MKLLCALVLTLTNLVIATPFGFSVKGSGASAKAGAVTAPFGIFGVVQPVASNAGYRGSFSKPSSSISASGGTALGSSSFSHNSAQDNRAPWPGYGTSFTTQAQAVGQNILTFPQVNKNSITSFSDTSIVATTGANGQTEITGSYPSENSNDLYLNNSGASDFQYQVPSEKQEKNPSSTLGEGSLKSETYEISKPNALNFTTISKVPDQSVNFKETPKVQKESSQIVTGGSAYLTFPNGLEGNTVPQITVASSENYQISEKKPNYNGGFGGPPGILKPFDKGSIFKSNDSANAFLNYKPNVQLSAPVTTKPEGFDYTPENTIKPSYAYTNKGSTDKTKPTVQPLSSGSSNFNADISYKPERNPTYAVQIEPTFANNIGKPLSVLKPNDDQVHILQHFYETTHTSDGTLSQSIEDSSKPQFFLQIPSKFNKPTIDGFSESKPINKVQVAVQAYPNNGPNSSSNYNVNYENDNAGNESSEKLSNKPTKQSLYTSSFGAPAGVLKPFDQLSPSSTFASALENPEVYDTSKSYLGFTVTGQKETTNTGGSSNILSATEQPSMISANYNTNPAPFISSTPKVNKEDNVTNTVQIETNQPSNKPSQSSSFNLTNQKTPSLFNVASSGVQSSTLGSNSYPIKPQSQLPEKQVFESGSQNKPLLSNTFGTFGTPKPTSYLGSTAYTSFSYPGYGNSGVFGSSDKSKPTSQFTTTNQYKPSFTTSFGGQSGVLKPSNQPTQTSSTFISSNKPTNYKPVATPSPLNIAKPNEDYLVADPKDSSIVNNFGIVSSSPQQSSDTAPHQPSIVNTSYNTSPAPFISSNSPSSESNAENHKDASGPAISSTSKTDKKDDVTTTVQTETNQSSNEPSQSSSLNLTNQKNPSLFNVASSVVQSSTLGSNSYSIKPQSQLPEKQVFESGSQNKPLLSNTFGTFGTSKPTIYPDSTAYTSFSSPGYGNSGVFGSSDKSKPTGQFTTTNQYKPSFTTSFGGQSGVLKPSNQPTQTSSTFISSNKPTNYKPVVTPSPLNIAKPNEDYLVTDQKDSSIVNNFGTVSSLPQQLSDTASQQLSIVNTSYNMSPAPFISSNSPSSESNTENHKDASGPAISSTSKTDKKDDVTTTVQTETNQPSNKPSQSSSFNLTNQKNPSLFNVASSGVQSSTLGLNSYPIKPQSQLPEKQVFEFGSQKKPLLSNTFGTFGTPKPTSYLGSTAYTSFSYPGYGNSGVFESLDKSKPTSQFTTTNQYKPSFTTSFGGQSGVLKPSNQPTQTNSTFISSYKPTNYKPVVTPSPLNIAKPNEDYLVTDQKDSSIVNNFGIGSSSPQQSSDTASQQPSIVNTSYNTSPAPFILSNSPSSESNAENHKDASGPAISSTSKTDKKDDVTTTVQTETNQPSNKPSQSSSFNLTNQKNPSLFNVASSAVQSSTLGSNSYPIKPQSQLPEKQVFESGSQNKPLLSNTFGTFGTPIPTSYPDSTAYTSFPSPGYGNSGVFGSSDKSKPTSQFTTTNQYKPSFTTSFGGQSGVLKPSNQPIQTSSTFISSNKPTNYKPVATPSPLNIAKPNEDYLVTDPKDSSIVNNFGTVSSSPQQSSDTAPQQPFIVNTSYNTSPAPFISSNSPSSESNAENHKDASGPAISSTSKTDKKDDVTTTVQTEANQPSNEPSQSSSLNLINQKNPSLFNVASSGVQSSTLGSNSYPIKPQYQLPEKQVFESGSQNKPLLSNTFGTFGTPKPTIYPDSTAYTSFTSPGYGNSGVFGSSDKSKPTSQFTTTNQYKPSFTTSFGGQSGVLKPSNQPTQTSSTFISSYKPTNYKPVVTPSPLNIAKPNEDYLVTDQKDSSIVNNFGTGSSSPQQSSDTASQQPSIVNTSYNTSPAPFISSNSPSSESNAENHKDASSPAISSTSKTDKKDDVTTTVQTETNQPSNKPSQSSSFNLTNQKNPPLFNVASSGVQSSTLGSNSYPIKPQSQLPEKQVFESGSQKKPLLSNTFGTFGTPKPTSYLGSTAYTSFSYPGYGNSGVFGSLDKSKPTSQFTTTNQYKPSFTTSFGGQSGVLKPSNQPTQTSSTFISSYKPTNYKPVVTPSPLNIAKPNEDYLVTDQKDSSIVNNFGTGSSSPQQSSDTASQQPSIVNTSYNTSPAPFISSNSPSSESNAENHKDASSPAISSTSKTDKKDDVTTTVQTETNQPSNKPSQSSSFNLTNQKNPSLFNVASSGVQSSTLGSNSYPIKPQSQLPEKQVFESGSQKKPLLSNTFGTFGTPKPTSYPDSTAYTSFSPPGYGNSGVLGSFTTSFGGQSGAQTSSFTSQNKPQSSSDFGVQIGIFPSNLVSSNTPLTSKPFVSPVSLNKSPQKVSELNHYNLESVTGFQSAYVPSKSSSQQFSGNSALFNIQQSDFHLSKPNIQNSVIGQPISTTVQLPYAGGFGGPAGILKPNEFSAPANHINILSQYNPNHYNQALATPHRELNLASYSGGFGGSSGVLKPVKKEINTSAGNTVNDNQYFSIVHSSGLQGTLTENPAHSNYNLIPNKSLTEVQSNFEQSTLGSKATEEAQSGVEYQASVAATKGAGEFINPSHNIQSLERSINNGASSGIGLELPKNNKSLNGQIGGLKILRLIASNQGSTENGISSNAFGKSLAPGSAIAQGSSGFITKNVFGRK
ncbi:unnamed protein product [Parnassius apollo]|uniref:(apollo) hypothetical protein n=1 Tax=Parnassius apollo TaxID=110799 RepID=A0A8S3WUV3_PARAO|nr:unnamed protein product [Parnassius apollo]